MSLTTLFYSEIPLFTLILYKEHNRLKLCNIVKTDQYVHYNKKH